MKKRKTRGFKVAELKCIIEVHNMMLAGMPYTEIARFIQDEREEYLDVKRVSLTKRLSQYYARHIKEVQDIVPLPIMKANETVENSDRLQELRRLNKLYYALDYEFDRIHARSVLTGAAVEESRKLSNAILKIVEQMHEIKMDLGLLGSRDLGTVSITQDKIDEIEKKFKSRAAREVLKDPVSRSRVLSTFGKLAKVQELAEAEDENIIDAEFSEPKKKTK